MSYKRYLVLSDVHVPSQDHAAISAVCAFAKDYRPHGLILNGDILDLPEISRHSAGSLAQLEGKRIAKTFAAGNKFLDQVGAAVGKTCTEKHWINGNHESRWYRWLAAGDNAVFADDDLTDIPARLKLRLRGYKYHRDYPTAHVKLGHLTVSHGQWTGKYAAARHLERYQTSILVGHTHTSQAHHASTFTGQRGAYCAGFLADPDSPAMAYAPLPKAWITGFATVTVDTSSGNFWVNLHNFVNGVFHVGAKTYGKKKV